jgi:hypothetical protein
MRSFFHQGVSAKPEAGGERPEWRGKNHCRYFALIFSFLCELRRWSSGEKSRKRLHIKI